MHITILGRLRGLADFYLLYFFSYYYFSFGIKSNVSFFAPNTIIVHKEYLKGVQIHKMNKITVNNISNIHIIMQFD